MLKFFIFACSNFWVFIGCVTLLTIMLSYLPNLFGKFLRFIAICLRGWPKKITEETTDMSGNKTTITKDIL